MDKISKPYIAPVAGYVHENCVTSCCCILYEFIHKQKTRRAHVSKFIHIYIDFRYAGVPTVYTYCTDGCTWASPTLTVLLCKILLIYTCHPYVVYGRRLRMYNDMHVAICVSRSRTYKPSSTWIHKSVLPTDEGGVSQDCL